MGMTRILIDCGVCGKKLTASCRLAKQLLSAPAVVCPQCFEVNLVVISLRQVESPRVFPLARKFHPARTDLDQEEILAGILWQLFTVLLKAMSDESILGLLKVTPEEARALRLEFISRLQQLGIPESRSQLLANFSRLLQRPTSSIGAVSYADSQGELSYMPSMN